MKTVFEHIKHVKGKPHHIRKRIAFTVAVSVTAFVALVWLVGSFSFGAFAIAGTSFADSAGQGSVVATGNDNGSQNLAGAAAGISGALSSTSGPARIEIIDAASTTAGQKKAEQTVIPF
jgi:hypothetical protein